LATFDLSQPLSIPESVHTIDRGDTLFLYSVLGRAFYFNDQRLQWSGQEATFGAEGVFAGAVTRQFQDWQIGMQAELFLTQPYNDNILVDTPERVSFRGNFDDEALEVSELFIEARRGDLSISVGKRYTPFGRVWFPLDTNRLFDAPFIRTESINFRETGLRMDYTPGRLDLSVALTNGSEDLDTNSTKAGIARIGFNGDGYAFGGSVKFHDGVGSEAQKYRQNHVGLDGMITRGRWNLSGEIIYDEYGFRRAFDPLDITWGRSIYNRDQFFAGGPLRGTGYYLNLNYLGDTWSTTFNYGVFSPNVFTGDAIHDRNTHRGYAKFVRHFGQGLDAITTVILDNDVPIAQAARIRKGFLFFTGLEYGF